MSNPHTGSSFRDWYNELVAEVEAEGPEAVAEFEALHVAIRRRTHLERIERELGRAKCRRHDHREST
ncbi:MAG: hypothetical protein FWD17_13335 [Polyangiaceae bacterium]|nr:hypothetical protein [Polyangiaceae bacterium]